MPVCPECKSQKTWKDGLRYVHGNAIQRFSCRNCGYRFSDNHYKECQTMYSRQICFLDEKAKNLVAVESRKKTAGENKTEAEFKGKIVEYLWHLKKNGYRPSTIENKVKKLERLVKLGANLFDPESVKEVIANDNWNEGYKSALVRAYNTFTEMAEIKWKPPIYKTVQKLPFIPHEKEIYSLISGCGKKVATSLQLLKETGMRIGEAWNLKWIDIDVENCIINVTPEKHGTPRQFKASQKLIGMLNNLPKNNQQVFGDTSLIAHRFNYTRQRKRIAEKLQNPRLIKIKFHTLRHWFASNEYHKTKDILHVQERLGHRKITSTMVYTHLIKCSSNDYHVKTAKTLEEACALAKSGFKYFTTIEDVQVFHKPK